jgi:transposase
MPRPFSNDLGVRVVEFIEAGNSLNEAAAHFGTSVSFAVKLMKLWRETGSVEPRPSRGFRHGKIGPHKDFILAVVAENSGITMPELAKKLAEQKGVKVDPSRLSNFLIGCGLNYKKHFGQANKIPDSPLSWASDAMASSPLGSSMRR